MSDLDAPEGADEVDDEGAVVAIESLINTDFAGYTPSKAEQMLVDPAWYTQGTPSCEFVTVTPYVAYRWLQRNIHNRELKAVAVSRFQRDMQTGHWVETGDPVRFDTEGSMNDGQHRLISLMRSGVTMRMLVVRGLIPEARDYFDVGNKRGLADVLTIGGMKGADASAVAAGANVMLRWERGYRTAGDRVITQDMQVKWTEMYAAGMEDSVQQTRNVAKSAHFKPSQLAAFHFLLTEGPTLDIEPGLYAPVDPALGYSLDLFLDSFGSGAGLANDDPILCLRNWIANQERAQKAAPWMRWNAALIVAWNAYIKGDTMKRLAVPNVGTAKNSAPFPAILIPRTVVAGV